MTFDEILSQVQDLLQREKRVSYRGLKRRFALDDEYLEDLKEELIGAKRLATDEDGRFLVWTGAQETTAVPSRLLSPQSPVPPAELRPLEAERRQLTVMFCDLVGSTALSTQLDPEELREVVQAYQGTCTEVIQRYEAYLAQHMGDGLLVYFGYPMAHEDEPQRAVRTSLEMIAALHRLNLRLPHPLQVRIGIHTGLVVVGEVGSGAKREVLALGETPNLAARLQGLAEPDTVIISEATYHLVRGLFDCHALAPQEVKGFSTPLTVYRVLGASDAQSRFEAALTTGLTPLVGRAHEMGLLRERWEKAKEGEGQAVLLSGEPGIGKSRLAQELKEQVSKESATRIVFRCSPYYQNTALHPIIEHLPRLLRFEREDTPHTKLDKLLKALSSYQFPQADTAPLLTALLSLPHPENYPPLTLSPQKQKQKTHEALVAWIMEEAKRQVVYCLWEDLHWADPTTLEILHLYLEQVPTARMLAVLTFRPEFQPPWSSRSHLSLITLSRLGRKHVERMAENLTGGRILPAEVVQQIVGKADGVPLFVEELTKTVLEAVGTHGRAPLPPLAIPATLHDSLMTRLDRLNTAKEVAQLGATVGREFSYELLHTISRLDEEALQQGLTRLVEAELVYQRGAPPQALYLFKHVLVQQTAYQSLLKSKRQQYHQQIAQVLEEKFSETKETQPELLAHHYTEAGFSAQAIPYWQQAGQRAVQRSANVEAISHLTKGLELLKTLPDTPECTQQEFLLQAALGASLAATKGFGAPEVGKAYARAQELCKQGTENLQLFPVLIGLRSFYAVRGEFRTAHELGEQLLQWAQHLQDPLHLLEAHHGLATSLFHLGELIPARRHIEESFARSDFQHHRSRAFLYGFDIEAACLSYGALILQHLGYPEQALKKRLELRSLAEGRSHPFSRVYALVFAALFHSFRREGQAVQEPAEAAIALSTEQGFPLWIAFGTILQGWALADQGQGEEGIARMLQGLTAFRATGAEVACPHFLALLAEVSGKAGQATEGLAGVAEALALVDKSEGRVWEPALYQLKGELTLQSYALDIKSPVEKEAEECFLKAIEIARRQSAKSWELRAATSLARLWQHQGKKAEARRMLAEIYNWFTEGFETKDLQDAKGLLEKLS